MQYIVISPTRDEGAHLPRTIESMVKQSLKPLAWIIVNDGSKDETGRIAKEAAVAHPWIRVVHRPDRGFRQAGGGVIEAFYAGLQVVEQVGWDFVVKLDADLEFGGDYFAKCFKRFEADPRLGIAGGTVCETIDGRTEPESKTDPAFHVRGATKIYRRQCWQEIGGLLRSPGWDTVDELKANMLGWKTLTFDDIHLVHQRFTGKAYGIWNDWMKGGRAHYVAGYHPLFMVVKVGRRLFNRPFVIGASALFLGYIMSYLRGVPRVPDEALIRYFQHEQFNRLLGRKSLWS